MRLFYAFLLVELCYSYKFLVYSPLFGHSHTTFMAKIADTLTAAGHEVTFLVPILDIDHLGKSNVSLTKDVIVIDADPRVAQMLHLAHQGIMKQIWEMSWDIMSMISIAKNFSLSSVYACEHLLKQEALISELRSRKFDVGIAEPINICGLGFMELLEIPSMIGAVSVTQLDLVSYLMGEPLAPSYVPATSSGSGDEMTFFERATNAFSTLGQIKFIHDSFKEEAKHLETAIGSRFSGIGNLISKCSFIFTNSNPYLNYPRPLLHKTVEIGGITIEDKEVQPLEKKWDDILNERKHNVFISFGTNAKSKDMPEKWMKSFIETFAAMPEVTFIWKYEESTKRAENLPNVHLAPWLPQNSLLGGFPDFHLMPRILAKKGDERIAADKRLSIFITHGGLGSTNEVAHRGKPSIMIPLFGDQPRNAEMLARAGGALVLNKHELDKSSVIEQAIRKMLKDNKYLVSAEKLAKMLKEQPISPKDLVVKHAEFVAKFGPLKQLEPYGRHLSSIQYYLIDVIAAFCAIFLITLALFYFLMRFLYRKICCRSQKLKTE